MTEAMRYVEVRLGGGIPQFIALDQWQDMDAGTRAGYTVVNADLTEDQVRQRQSELANDAANRAAYAAPAAGGGGADTGGGS